MAKKNDERPEESLKERFDRWDDIYKNGCSDPFWSDGVNLGFVRNHILYYKSEIEKAYPDGSYPAIYYRETPPEVPNGYMARAEEIRNHAKEYLEELSENKLLQYIRKKAITVNPKFLEKTMTEAVLKYEDELRAAIEEDNLVAMRNFEKRDRYNSYIEECADKLREYVPPVNEQISLFEFNEDEGMNLTL